MKLITEHLGEIIVAIAGVALLISVCVVFGDPLSEFFSEIINTLTEKGGNLLDSINVPVANTIG